MDQKTDSDKKKTKQHDTAWRGVDIPPHKSSGALPSGSAEHDSTRQGDEEMTLRPLSKGIAVLRRKIRHLPTTPGVYRMLNKDGKVLYVGKAKNLKKRVTSYTLVAKMANRLQRMVSQTENLEIITTHTEAEALLLESNLIKKLRPPFNILLRDDKSFPYIFLTGDHDYPQLTKHRGARVRPGKYFGPFASAGAVNRTLIELEKAFLLRSCSDTVFASRIRPCLLYQIKRCSAPCVSRISRSDYSHLVNEAADFLGKRTHLVQQNLATQMLDASKRQDFELAAQYRDRIKALAQIQSHQGVNVLDVDEADVIAVEQRAGKSCIQVFFFRSGRNYGNRAYYPKHDASEETSTILSAFLAQFYQNKPIPPCILLSNKPAQSDLLAEAFSISADRKVTLSVPQRGAKKKMVDMARQNAKSALDRYLAENLTQRNLLTSLAERFDIQGPPLERIEVYDNSHIQGANPYGVMIVASEDGFQKSAYRKFSIRGVPSSIKPIQETQHSQRDAAKEPGEGQAASFGGDDYAMMREVMLRRFTRGLRDNPEQTGDGWPDLLLIDGGKGQVNAVLDVLQELNITNLPVIGVAKGPDRNAGREKIIIPGRPSFLLPPNDPVLFFIQRLRDEAHRFAIGAHRLGRTKARLTSKLDAVPGIGSSRKKALLMHFGSARAVETAGLKDLEAVQGINKKVARQIYEHFHK